MAAVKIEDRVEALEKSGRGLGPMIALTSK